MDLGRRKYTHGASKSAVMQDILVSVMSVNSESEVDSIVTLGSGRVHGRLALWQKEHQGIGQGACSCH